ncbi:C-type lectin-like protein [Canarypox virus]|uniref:CNPV272 C-type lectin-like EEV protein n=2 Tax=Avipoxvirus TaxID=10260 RepID=Q6VZ75_CNPV|nr:C-type lectin-like protein [Canarypox virus]AAP12552.1 HGPV 198 [Hawaiian goose poxvirus]AAR83618.1 CNPV272 C-type lectin-like EEV protein [Canarypox virus]AWD84748.1 C-type lectin-like protein [Canarypox virus]
MYGVLYILNMNRQTITRVKKSCTYLIHTIAALLGTFLLTLFATNVTLYNKLQICGNRDGMAGWVLINNNCYTLVENITFTDLIRYCAMHDSIIPNSLEQKEVLLVSSALGVMDYWMPFTKKKGKWFHGKKEVEVKGDQAKRLSMGKTKKPRKSEKCSIYYDGIIEEYCDTKHRGICFTQYY